jgi:hypothetical protein
MTFLDMTFVAADINDRGQIVISEPKASSSAVSGAA